MSSPKDKPRGYFKYLLTIDCETTGLNFETDDPSDGQQTVSWGVIVADATTLKPVEDLYVEIKWNEESIRKREEDPSFGKKAEKIHGLTQDYLEQNGVTEEEAVTQIANLILKYWGPTVSVRTLGHNVHTFDMPFLRSMFRRVGIELKFGNRHYDTNSLGFMVYETFNSDDLFSIIGFDERGQHNALEDAHMALKSARVTRKLFKGMFEGDTK